MNIHQLKALHCIAFTFYLLATSAANAAIFDMSDIDVERKHFVIESGTFTCNMGPGCPSTDPLGGGAFDVDLYYLNGIGQGMIDWIGFANPVGSVYVPSFLVKMTNATYFDFSWNNPGCGEPANSIGTCTSLIYPDMGMWWFHGQIIGDSISFYSKSGNNTANGTEYIKAINVAAVPVPGAVWLFGSGLGLLAFNRRRKK